MTSKPRSTIYVFGATILALVAFYIDAEADEIALWQAALGAAIPFAGLVYSAVKTWPKRNGVTSTEREALRQIDRIVGNEDSLTVEETARVRGIILNGPEQ